MSDKTMDDIKSGKGLPPLPNNSDSTQSGTTMEQRNGKGITYETFSRHDKDKENKKNK